MIVAQFFDIRMNVQLIDFDLFTYFSQFEYHVG